MMETSDNLSGDFLVEKLKTWCRLCARADGLCANIITGEGQQSKSLIYGFSNIALAIENLFRVHIEEDETLSQLICTECYQIVISLIKYRDRVKKVQEMYNDIRNHQHKDILDIKALYEKYDLTENEPFWLQTTDSTKLPVEEIFVADLPLTKMADLTGIEIKDEKKADEVPADICIQNYAKEVEFVDPIGAEDNFDQQSFVDEDRLSSGSESEETKMPNEKNVAKDSTNFIESLEYNYICIICAESFRRISTYVTHMQKEHGEINCPLCALAFKNAFKLRIHMKEHPKAFNCVKCDKQFDTRTRLGRHISCAHDKEQPLICEICGVTLLKKKQLRDHMLQHTDYSPFECKVCGARFKLKSRLKRHMQIHGDKYICPKCGKQLSTRATLKDHLLVHSDEMSHKCEYCGRLFKRANTLKNHLIAHTDLRPYACDFCDKRFSTGPSCRFHKKTMHPKELAELEATGAKAYTKNIPTLQVLKAVSREGVNLKPLASKQNGCVYFDKEIQVKTDTPKTNM
ncbi:zinc finger protein OZF [Ceratitis capitata]|nr:zinc finger protein OZF [Ceratitis capitata]